MKTTTATNTTLTTTAPAAFPCCEVLAFYTDPGHGWLCVPRRLISAVGLRPSSFSRFSYADEAFAYLEEDCDAPRFLRDFVATFGHAPETVERHANHDSPIRNLPRIA
jgi:hypothetical protein